MARNKKQDDQNQENQQPVDRDINPEAEDTLETEEAYGYNVDPESDEERIETEESVVYEEDALPPDPEAERRDQQWEQENKSEAA